MLRSSVNHKPHRTHFDTDRLQSKSTAQHIPRIGSHYAARTHYPRHLSNAFSRIGDKENYQCHYGRIKRHLCSDVLPDVGRFKSCVQEKIGQLPKGCLDKLLDSMAGGSFKVCKNQTYALCAAARCNVYDGVAYCQCDVKHGDSISLPFQMGKEEVLLDQRRRGQQQIHDQHLQSA